MSGRVHKRRGLMLVVSSPSGAGKSTLCGRLLQAHGDVAMSVSATTRPPREGEVEGEHYHFLDHATFERRRDEGGFLEWAKVFDNYYGTPREPVERALAEGRDVLFDVDWQGAQKLAQEKREDVVKVFILPPSRAEIERRLKRRASDSEEVVRRRMSKFADEISHASEYDYVIVNDELDRAYEELEAILLAERRRTERKPDLIDFINAMTEEG